MGHRYIAAPTPNGLRLEEAPQIDGYHKPWVWNPL
jgi:hypothetical protein